MFSIQKKHKVQALFYNENFKNPKGPEIKEAIDPNHPNGKVYQLLSEIKERAGSIQDHTRTLDAEHLRNLGLNNLVPFFVAHPNFYYDLKRKIHKIHANKETGGRYQIPKEKEEEIFSIFLRFASHNTMSTDAVERVIRDEVFGNRKLLITLSEGSVSLLDTSHGDIQRKIKEGKMTRINCIRFIESVVREGLHINNQDNNKQNIQAILPKITDYLKSIFNISYELKGINTIHSLAELVYKNMNTDDIDGLTAKKAWILIKSFTAWSAIIDIEKMHEKGKEYLQNIPTILEGADGITLNQIQAGKDGVYSSEIIFDIHGEAVTCHIDYRLKSIRSILLKMWENADYNTIDAMRDIIGIAIVFPPNTNEMIRTEIIKKMNGLFMLPRQYMFKNKGLIVDKENITGILNNRESPPLNQRAAISRNKKSKAELINASASGFSSMTQDNNPEDIIGCEIQYYTPEGYEFWKVDHYLYDPLKVMSAWSRGSWFLTPHQAMNCIEQEISTDIIFNKFRRTDRFKHLGSPQDILYDYLKKLSLLAFLDTETQGVYIVPLDHEEAFTNKFKSRMRKIHIRTGQSPITNGPNEKRKRADNFHDFIDSLKSGKGSKKA